MELVDAGFLTARLINPQGKTVKRKLCNPVQSFMIAFTLRQSGTEFRDLYFKVSFTVTSKYGMQYIPFHLEG